MAEDKPDEKLPKPDKLTPVGADPKAPIDPKAAVDPRAAADPRAAVDPKSPVDPGSLPDPASSDVMVRRRGATKPA